MSPWNSSSGNGTGTGTGDANGNQNYIEHQVSRFDTLAGVAIKYGVEVADIKKLNNLATDLQMFALKSLHIPLPGRHPPSPALPNFSTNSGESSVARTLPHLGRPKMLRSKSPQQKISSAMDTLQKYYGLKPPGVKDAAQAEGMEMAVYSNGISDYFDDGLLPRASPTSDLISIHDHKSRSLIDSLFLENDETAKDMHIEETGDEEGDRSNGNEKRVRRRQKSESGAKGGTSERLLREDTGSGSSDFSPITGKGLALRPKSASRSIPGADTPIPLGDSIFDGFSGVRKSSSMPSLPDQDNSSSSSAWQTPLWSLKPDLQVLSAASITRPIFDGLPKPITGRRNKAALD